MVWRENGYSPNKVHVSQELARGEAERLARAHRGERFYVLEAVGCVASNDVVWMKPENAGNDEECPF